MKFGLVIVLVALVCAIAFQALLTDPGYVAIEMRGHVLQMSVPALLALIVLLVFALLFLRWLVVAPRRLGEAAGRYRAGRSGQKLTRGMIEVAEGNLARGEKLLAQAAVTSDSPLFNYLQAARAAHLQGHDERRDEWLRKAYSETPEATHAVLLTQAEFQLDRGDYEQALATLRKIEEGHRDHSYAAHLLGRIYFRLADWDSLAELLPRLAKQGRVKPGTLEQWSVAVHRAELERAASGEEVVNAWKQVPRTLRGNLSLLDAYYAALIRTGMNDKAEKDLAQELKTDWRGPLVRLFGLVEGQDASRQLKRAESWLVLHPNDPDLLLAAARLCLRNELWGKARSYLESVLAMRPSPEAYQEYGKLLSRLGETDAAAEAYRDGLNLVAGAGNAAQPQLERLPAAN
jgi:HemY protein